MGYKELSAQFQQMEARLRSLAPRLKEYRNAVTQASVAVSSAQSQLAAAQAEYSHYAGYSGYNLDEEHQQQLQAIQQQLGQRLSQAQAQLSQAQNNLTAARSRLASLESALRDISAGYGKIKNMAETEMQKLFEAENKAAALMSGNRYGGSLSGVRTQIQTQRTEILRLGQYCAQRIRQIQSALSSDSGEERTRDRGRER